MSANSKPAAEPSSNPRAVLPEGIGPQHVINFDQASLLLGLSKRHFSRLLRQRRLKLRVIRVSERRVGVTYGDVVALIERAREVGE